MASRDSRHRTSTGTYFRFFLRVLGLTGILVAALGIVFPELLYPGLGVVGGWFLLELLMGLYLASGAKTVSGGNTILQGLLAIAFLLIVNGISLKQHARFDLTRAREFTLPATAVEKLRTLDPNQTTDIIVYRIASADDALADAADRKIIEKVDDLVALIRELGPRFRVTLLNRKDEDFEDRLSSLTEQNEPLRKAIEAAPESSIFFHARQRVERLGFSEFYLLDRQASRRVETSRDGKERTRTQNLVMHPQGFEGFLDRVLAVGRPRPRIGLLVVHPFLSSGGGQKDSIKIDQYTSAGLRDSLERNGFDVVDIILKKNWFSEDPIAPAADRFAEFNIDDVESEYLTRAQEAEEYEAGIRQLGELRTEAGKLIDKADAESDPSARLKLYQQAALMMEPFTGGRINSVNQVRAFYQALPSLVEELKQLRTDASEKAAKLKPQYLALLQDDELLESRRRTDVKSKLRDAVAECDLLIVPRLTTVELAGRNVIAPDLFYLVKEQVDVLKDFMTEGKPVLFAFGPTSVGVAPQFNSTPPDEMESLIERFGIQLGPQTIITDAEKDVMARQRNGNGLGETSELPPLRLTDDPATRHPIATAVELAARANQREFDIRKSGCRPITLASSLKVDPRLEILKTVRESWNEDRPTPGRGYVPKYEPTKPDDPNQGTRLQERRGPFLVGVAVEGTVPADWQNLPGTAPQAAVLAGAFAPSGIGLPPAAAMVGWTTDPINPLLTGKAAENPRKSRLVVLGHGGIFTGNKLSPANESLLLNAINWQLKRTDRIPHEDVEKVWSYPRVSLNEQQTLGWHWGAFLGLPLLAVYFGLIVLLYRGLR